jgi:hypothetical protein
MFTEQMGRQNILNLMVASIPRILSDLNFLVNAIFIFAVVPKYLNFATPSNDLLAVIKL